MIRDMGAYLINKLLTLTPIGRWLDGKKSYIGVTLVLLSYVLDFLEKAAPLFPQMPQIGDAANTVGQFLDAAARTLEMLGYGTLAVGLGHKLVKEKLPEE